MWILALDVGTSSVRAIGYDAAGLPLPGADARTAWEPVATSDGGAELDPEALVTAAASTIDRCLAAGPGPPAAVGASGTGLLDQRAGTWDARMLSACDIGPEHLPPIDDTPVVGLAPAFSTRWPQLLKVPWLPGAGDGACSNLGLDCATPERIALNVG